MDRGRVASRSWLMATPLRLKFLGHPTCAHERSCLRMVPEANDTGALLAAPQVEGHFS